MPSDRSHCLSCTKFDGCTLPETMTPDAVCTCLSYLCSPELDGARRQLFATFGRLRLGDPVSNIEEALLLPRKTHLRNLLDIVKPEADMRARGRRFTMTEPEFHTALVDHYPAVAGMDNAALIAEIENVRSRRAAASTIAPAAHPQQAPQQAPPQASSEPAATTETTATTETAAPAESAPAETTPQEGQARPPRAPRTPRAPKPAAQQAPADPAPQQIPHTEGGMVPALPRAPAAPVADLRPVLESLASVESRLAGVASNGQKLDAILAALTDISSDLRVMKQYALWHYRVTSGDDSGAKLDAYNWGKL